MDFSKQFVVAAAFVSALSAALPMQAQAGTVTNVYQTRSFMTRGNIGWPNTPLIVSGAEQLNANPVAIARAMRFPPSMRAGGSFVAVPPGTPVRGTYAKLKLRPRGGRVEAFLQFMHGPREFGAGTFSMSAQEFGNPAVIGSASATLINDMIHRAEMDRRNSKPFKLLRRR